MQILCEMDEYSGEKTVISTQNFMPFLNKKISKKKMKQSARFNLGSFISEPQNQLGELYLGGFILGGGWHFMVLHKQVTGGNQHFPQRQNPKKIDASIVYSDYPNEMHEHKHSKILHPWKKKHWFQKKENTRRGTTCTSLTRRHITKPLRKPSKPPGWESGGRNVEGSPSSPAARVHFWAVDASRDIMKRNRTHP